MHEEPRGTALLLPGMSLNATIFPELGMPVVAPDLSGIELGKDGITAELVRDGFGVYRRLVNEELRQSECWSADFRLVVGHSFGGMLALSWLLEGRDAEISKIDGLVLLCTTAGPMYRRARMRVKYPFGGEGRIPVGWTLPLWNRSWVTRAVKGALCKRRTDTVPTDFGGLGISSDGDLARAGWRSTDWRAIRAYRFSMAGFDVRERLGELTAPTIVLQGTEDSLFDVEDAKLLCRRMPNAELRLVRGAGHALPITHENELRRAVTDLLGS